MPRQGPGPVLHLIPFLWSGAGGVVTRLCEGQAARRPVTIVTTGRSGELSDWPAYRRRLERADVTHHTLDLFHRDAPAFWRAVDALAGLIRKVQPDVIHAHAGVPTTAAVMARDASTRRPRLLGQMYSWGPDRAAWMDTQDMWGFARADRTVCSARAYWDLLAAHGVPTRRLVYLPWGLPLEELPFRGVRLRSFGATADRLDTPGPTLGFVGRIEPRKDQIGLVEMLARLRRRLPHATLDLVGPVADEPYARALQSAIDRRGLRDAVTLHDRVPRVLPFLQRWDAFVSLSSDEGQGLAVLEAMAVGVPVVARPVAGIEDFLANGVTGVAIGRAGAAAAAAAVARLLTDIGARRRIVRGARRLVERRYSWDRMQARFDRLYAER